MIGSWSWTTFRGITHEQHLPRVLGHHPARFAHLWPGDFPASGSTPPTPPIGIPIRLQLDRAGYVTIVIEDGEGRRVRNLAAEALLPPGQATFWWDGYDEGERNSQGDLVRRRGTARPAHTLYAAWFTRASTCVMSSPFTVQAVRRGRPRTARGGGSPITRRRPTSSFYRKGPAGPDGHGRRSYLSARRLERPEPSSSG